MAGFSVDTNGSDTNLDRRFESAGASYKTTALNSPEMSISPPDFPHSNVSESLAAGPGSLLYACIPPNGRMLYIDTETRLVHDVLAHHRSTMS